MSDGFKYDADGPYIDKDPRSKLDYTVDWSAWAGASETIVSSIWSAATGITVVSTQVSTRKATAWLSGGADGSTYIIRCFVITNGGREDARQFRVKVADK